MNLRIQKILLLWMILQAAVLMLTGCGAEEPGTDPAPPVISEAPADSAPEVPADPAEDSPLTIKDAESLQAELSAAISAVRQPAPMDVSSMVWNQTPEIDVKNLYYEVLRQDPTLKYAYDLTAEVKDGLLTCRISYMPYRAGYPQDWDGIPVGSLPELIETAASHLGAEPVNIRLTDPALTPDGMNRALQQVGGGYLLCALSRDGTQLTYTPAMGMTMEECLSLLEQAETLAAEIAATLIDDTMTEREQAEALYTFLTRSVRYDQRYYTDRAGMSYHSQTAIGALRDGLAICGGYSHALVLLFEQAGIPCYTVTGTFGGENHMWNIAQLDGQWLWFDATADRSASPQYQPRHFAQSELEDRYFWDHTQLDWLLDE